MKEVKKVLFGGLITLVLGVNSIPIIDTYWQQTKHDKIFENIDESRFLKNNKGQAIYLPINKKGIDVVIDNNFTNEQKETIADAIKYCDDKFENIEYNIYLNNTKSTKNCIKINKGLLDKGVLGEATINTSGYKIVYPITITVDRNDYKNDYNLDGIVKHELLHTLGLADMYDQKYIDESIMYYTATGIDNLTDSDVQIINTLYANKYTNEEYNIFTHIFEPSIHQIKAKEPEIEL